MNARIERIGKAVTQTVHAATVAWRVFCMVFLLAVAVDIVADIFGYDMLAVSREPCFTSRVDYLIECHYGKGE